MKFGVVIFPGSNCDQDMIDVLERMKEQHAIEVVKLWHKEHDLKGCDFIVLPGGFSYGDYLRSGAIARFSPVMQEVIEFADKGGFVMGICNGFQIACEAGLLPGVLMHNAHRKFVCKNVFIRAENQDTVFTSAIPPGTVLKIPIAHGEGNFYADDKILQELNANGQVLFRYCDENGNLTDESNPNGAVLNIAGICSKRKNVFGMMPHPERAADPLLGNTDGLKIFNSILQLVEA
jgi:phosphoribosylformylglycinamidine synthase